MLFMTEAVASLVELDFQNPNCEFLIILCLSRHVTNWFEMTSCAIPMAEQ